jgi:hypothetical protein
MWATKNPTAEFCSKFAGRARPTVSSRLPTVVHLHMAIARHPEHEDLQEPAKRLLRSGFRSAPRYEFAATCQIDFEGLGRASIDALDLSAVGMRVSMPVLPDEGTRVRCAIPLPGGQFWLVGGNVVRVIESGGTEGTECGIAIAFEGVTHFDRTQLALAFG